MSPSAKLLALLLLLIQLVEAGPNPLITPFAASIQHRQLGGATCGFENANILSALTCAEGSTCVANPTYNVAGSCCRLGDNANCVLATQCIPQAELSSCDGACSLNSQITKCGFASPYCYTRYYVSGGSTPTEVGCTTTQGLFAYVYTAYTGGLSSVNFDVSTAPPGSVISSSRTSSAPSSTGAIAGGVTEASSSSFNEDSAPIGAIVGGVVGGVAALGLIAAVITWIVLRHRRATRAAQVGGSATAAHQRGGEKEWQPQTPMSPLSPQSGATRSPIPTQEIGPGSKRHELHQQQVVPELP